MGEAGLVATFICVSLLYTAMATMNERRWFLLEEEISDAEGNYSIIHRLILVQLVSEQARWITQRSRVSVLLYVE